MTSFVTMAEFLAARKLRLSAEEREARMMKECRDLLRLAGALGVFFGAWLGRGLGFW